MNYEYLQHGIEGAEAQNHKYISRKKGANGKWEYVYADDTAKTSRMRTKYSNFERRMGILQRRQARIEKMADGETYVDKRNPKGTMSKAEKMKETLKKIQNLTRRMGHYQDKYKELKGKNADIKSETHGGKNTTTPKKSTMSNKFETHPSAKNSEIKKTASNMNDVYDTINKSSRKNATAKSGNSMRGSKPKSTNRRRGASLSSSPNLKRTTPIRRVSNVNQEYAKIGKVIAKRYSK